MLDQNTTIILSAIIAAVSSLIGSVIGGFILPLLTHKLNHKSERENMVREKVEEAYSLSNQVKIWYAIKLREVCEVEKIENVIENIPFWFIDVSVKEVECPLERLETLIDFYAFSAMPLFNSYRVYVNRMRNIRESLRSKENRGKIKDLIDEFTRGLSMRLFFFSVKHDISKNKELDSFVRYYVLDYAYKSDKSLQDDLNHFEEIDNENISDDEKIKRKLRMLILTSANNFVDIHTKLQTVLRDLS